MRITGFSKDQTAHLDRLLMVCDLCIKRAMACYQSQKFNVFFELYFGDHTKHPDIVKSQTRVLNTICAMHFVLTQHHIKIEITPASQLEEISEPQYTFAVSSYKNSHSTDIQKHLRKLYVYRQGSIFNTSSAKYNPKISLMKDFWSIPDFIQIGDSKLSVILHELSHIASRTMDMSNEVTYPYDVSPASIFNFGINFPEESLREAENIAHFCNEFYFFPE